MPALLLNRRAFFAGFGCTGMAAGLPRRSADDPIFLVRQVRGYSVSGIALPAVAAACMPETLVIGDTAGGVPMHGKAGFQESLGWAGYVELRRYRFDREETLARVGRTFPRHGIRLLLTGSNGAFLLGFETLATREKAWRELGAEREWQEIRTHLEELAIYKVPKYSVEEAL